MSCYNCGKGKNDSLAKRLNKRVTILRPIGPDDPPPNVDEYNQPIDEQIEVAKLWASIEPLQGREYYAALQVNADVTTRIVIRYREGIDRTMIVRHKLLEFKVLYVINPKFENKELHLMCKERQ